MSDYWGPFAELRARAGQGDVVEAAYYEGVFAELYDQLATDDADVAGWLALAERQRGPVLELACGSGRLLLRLASAGHSVVGLDLSGDLLSILRRHLDELPREVAESVQLVHADARTFELSRRFPLIVLACTTVAIFDEAAARDIFRRAAAHLEDDGIFAFDYVVFDRAATTPWDGQIVRFDTRLGGVPAVVRMGVRIDGESLLANSHCELQRDDGATHLVEARRMRMLDDAQVERLLRECDLAIVERRNEPLDGADAESHTICCQRRRRSYAVWHPYSPMNEMESQAIVLAEGRGSRVRDTAGNVYIDATAGLWSTQCGLGNSEIIDAIGAQLRRLSYGTLFAGRVHEPALELARRLIGLAPDPLQWVYFTGSGSESVELSIKLARLHFSLRGEHEKKEIVHLDHSYHGTFFGSMSVSGLYEGREAFAPLLPGFSSIPAPLPHERHALMTEEDHALACAAELERRIVERAGRVAAFIVEPVLAYGGVIVPPRAYFDAISDICRRHDVLLILDEVATGFGRTGRWLACEHYDLRPDMLLVSKGITSGYLPLGAVLFSAAIGFNLLQHRSGIGHGSSHNGNPACCAAALATLDVLQRERLIERADESGAYFRTRLEELRAYRSVRDVRSIGLMLTVELMQEDGSAPSAEQVAAVMITLQRAGVLAYPTLTGIIFMPPLVITNEEIDCVADAMHGVLSVLRLRDGALAPAE